MKSFDECKEYVAINIWCKKDLSEIYTESYNNYGTFMENVGRYYTNQILADVNNKLTPIKNLVELLNDKAPQSYIDKELEQVKTSIEYLGNLKNELK